MFFKRKPAAKNAEVVSTSESSALTLNGLSLSSLPDPIPSDKVFSFGKLNGELLVSRQITSGAMRKISRVHFDLINVNIMMSLFLSTAPGPANQ